MKTKFTIVFALVLLASTAFGQVSLRITYDANQSGAECQPLGASELAMHSGAGTVEGTGWTNNPFGWGVFDINEMTSTGTDTWELIIDDLNEFYGVDPSETITDIGLVFHNDGTTLEGKSDACNDIFIRGLGTGDIVVENADMVPFDGVTASFVTGLSQPLKGVSNMDISPNPATDRAILNFLSTTNKRLDLVITNAVGQQISSQRVTSNQVLIERNNLPAGLYFATLMDEKGGRATQRFFFN